MEWIIGILILVFIVKFFRNDRFFTVVDIKTYEAVSAELRRCNQYEEIYYTDKKKLRQYCKRNRINVMMLNPNEPIFGKTENRVIIATMDMPNELYDENK